jgi:7-cyano-7-deazaguanine reductase
VEARPDASHPAVAVGRRAGPGGAGTGSGWHDGPVPEPTPTDSLTILGGSVRHPVEHVECFRAPEHLTRVRFTTEELASVCPVTGQPDLSRLVVEYEPAGLCVESKSLKLFLWSFRDRPVFAEALAAEIAAEIMGTAHPQQVVVTLTQRPRGGIEVQATVVLP